MSRKIELEFVYTDEDRKAANSLVLQHQVGGGSKVLTTVVLLLILLAMLIGLYVRVGREVAAAYRPLVYLAVSVVAVMAWVLGQRARRPSPVEMHVEVSEEGLAVRSEGGEGNAPWAAFAKLMESDDLFVLADGAGSTLAIPKRAFADDEAQQWFRSLATDRLSLAELPTAMRTTWGSSSEAGRVNLRIDLGFRDYLDLTLASWTTRGVVGGTAALMIATMLYSVAFPPPNAVLSGARVLLVFGLPSLLFTIAFLVLLLAIRNWLVRSRGAVSQELSLSVESFDVRSAGGGGRFPWSTFDRFKETPRSFLAWKSGGIAWMMLPKRAFATEGDIGICRDILARNLEESPWFFG